MNRNSFLSKIILALLISSCSDFLEYEPKGFLSSENVATADNAEALVIAAYAAIGNETHPAPLTFYWGYGSVRADDAYKGGGGLADQLPLNFYEQYYLTEPTNGGNPTYLPLTWTGHYRSISRANFALSVIDDIPDAEFANKIIRQAELRFLRAHSHFMLKILFNRVPYITDELSQDEIKHVSNNLSSDELWNKIADDLLFAYQHLPAVQGDAGRANRSSAAAYLAKIRLYQAYEQNDQHQVVNINHARLEEVIDFADAVTGSLEPDFANNFLGGMDHSSESLWAVQFSQDDGTSIGRLSWVTATTSPTGNPLYGCCGLHVASQNMVNAFKTDADGLPLFDTFNDTDIFNVIDANGYAVPPVGVTLDPRIDHTVGIPGRPFKYRHTVKQPGDMIVNFGWARVPSLYGHFANMKEQQAPDCSCFVKLGPFVGTSKNYVFIRYADVLLFKAEALIQLDRWDEALPIINSIRTRAANSIQKPLEAGASDLYNIGLYTSFYDKDEAFRALKFERRMELAMEGWRFFDLVRWGEAAETLNAYLAEEKTKRDYLSLAHFTAGRDEYFPIPQQEIDFTGGVYVQNPGY